MKSPKEPLAERNTTGFGAHDAVDLLDWKHRVFELYADIRAESDGATAWRRWRAVRELLFRDHPQSPLPPDVREWFRGGSYFEYDPAWRVTATVLDTEPAPRAVAASTGGAFGFTQIGIVRFQLGGDEHELELAWNNSYGGGLFLAFTDSTTGSSTYGGGRYLIDTVKGSDLGFDREAGTMLLDFNFAYNPSCSYDPRWACPLARSENRLSIPVTAGERHASWGPTTESPAAAVTAEGSRSSAR